MTPAAGEFGAHAVAALTGYGVAQARRVLDTLAHGYLIRPAGGDHHGMHDLLRAYAAEQAYLHDAEPDPMIIAARNTVTGYMAWASSICCPASAASSRSGSMV